MTPLDGGSRNDYYRIEGYAPKSREDVLVYDDVVGAGYFQTIGTALLAGRDFDGRDRSGSPPVAIVNATFARRFFGGASPLGKRFNTSDTLAAPIEIIGVVQDARYHSLRDTAYPMAFYPMSQDSTPLGNIMFLLRTTGAPQDVTSAALAAIAGISPNITVAISTLRQQVADSVVRERALATLSGFFGGLALLLAAVGLYGTLSYGVARRGPEIGVRVALGATSGSVLRLVLREVGTLVAVGLLLGLGAAIAITRLVSSFLYGLTPTDTWSFGVALLILLSAAGIAAYLPARRAARQDPMVALRAD
jgi:predicted permease